MSGSSQRRGSDFTQVVRSSLANQMTEMIRRAIVNGTLAPGEVISVREVASRVGVSATPVREALLQLSAAGLVEFLPGRVQIAEATPMAFQEAFELREAMEGMAARLAARRSTEAEVAEMKRLAENSISAADAGRAQDFNTADLEFHQLVARASRSRHVERYTLNALDLALTLRNIRISGNSFAAAFAYMHMTIADAIGRGDPDAAERESRAHVRNVAQLIMQKHRDDDSNQERRA